jgi:dimethylamine/trimethylamine dehydrogenase
MTKADIADLGRCQRTAVRRALAVGHDLVYVYAGHALGGIHHFLSRGTTSAPTSTAAIRATGCGC